MQPVPSENYFQALDYRILPPEADPDTAAPGEGISLSSLPLNCDILVPGDDDEIPAGPLTIRGWAMAGDGRSIGRVDVSLDEGHTWQQADLELCDQPMGMAAVVYHRGSPTRAIESDRPGVG